jgi:hypothetical protein
MTNPQGTNISTKKSTPDNPRVRMGLFGRILLGVYMIIASGLLVYCLLVLWSPTKVADTGTVTAVLFWHKFTFSADVQLIVIVVIAAALGSNVHNAMSFIDFTGNRKLFRSWVWWYILRVFVGVSLALIFYFVIRGGFLAAGNGATDINQYGIAAVAGLVGMFSKQANDKLKELFDTMFKISKPDGREDKITEAIPQINEIIPPVVGAGAKNVSLTVKGTGFVEGSVVHIGETECHTTYVSGAELKVDIPDAEVAKLGDVRLTVTNPPSPGESSNEYKFKVS